MVNIEGKEQKIEFIKWCVGLGALIFVVVILISCSQEYWRRRKLRLTIQKRNAQTLCTDKTTNGDVDPEMANQAIQNSLVVKKYHQRREKSTSLHASSSSISLTSVGSSDLLEDSSERDSDHLDNLETGKQQQSQRKSNRIVLGGLSSTLLFSNNNKTPKADCSKKSNILAPTTCEICHKLFHDGDDVGESANPRCSHMFHENCIASWLTYQHTCPVCSEMFVVPVLK